MAPRKQSTISAAVYNLTKKLLSCKRLGAIKMRQIFSTRQQQACSDPSSPVVLDADRWEGKSMKCEEKQPELRIAQLLKARRLKGRPALYRRGIQLKKILDFSGRESSLDVIRPTMIAVANKRAVEAFYTHLFHYC